MCGRYEFNNEEDIEEIEKILMEINKKYENLNNFHSGEIAPTNVAPILSLENNKSSLSLMYWGFPKWDDKGVVINARSETAMEKSMFSSALKDRRCVVPATGFYEWQKIDPSLPKDKYIFTTEKSPMLYMAGIYEPNKHNGKDGYSFVILTREANQYISDIHHRMPVILYKDELLSWLKDGTSLQYFMQRDNVVLNRREIIDTPKQMRL